MTDPNRPFCAKPTACDARGPKHCRSCSVIKMNADPERRAKASAAMKARLADPEERRRHIERSTKGLRQKMRTDPAFVERRRELGRRTGAMSLGRKDSVEVCRRRGRAISIAKMGWCPIDLRPLYRKLRNAFGARTARRMIEEQMQRDRRAAERRLADSMRLQAEALA